MQFVREGSAALSAATESEIRRAIDSLRTEGPSSFATLTSDNGSYLQAAGGPFLFLVEYRAVLSNGHFRAYLAKPAVAFPNGTLLCFGLNRIPMQQDEWITKPDVLRLFAGFLGGTAREGFLIWRPAPGVVV
jgi:hypothetical protein